MREENFTFALLNALKRRSVAFKKMNHSIDKIEA